MMGQSEEVPGQGEGMPPATPLPLRCFHPLPADSTAKSCPHYGGGCPQGTPPPPRKAIRDFPAS